MRQHRHGCRRSGSTFAVLILAGVGVTVAAWSLLNKQNAQKNTMNGTVNATNATSNAANMNTNTSANTSAASNAAHTSNNANFSALPHNSAPKSHAATSKTEIVRGDSSKKQIMFTFDAGAGTQSLQKILDTLAEHRARGTFFVTGKWVEKNPDSIKQIAAANHEIYNHTYSHPHLPQLSDAQITEEFTKTDSLVNTATGKATRPYFRAPYGDRNQHVLDVAFAAGYQSVYWTTDALDWKESDGYSAAQVEQRVLAGVKPGAIILMHVGDTLTGAVLDDLLNEIEKQGYSVVGLSEGLEQ